MIRRQITLLAVVAVCLFAIGCDNIDVVREGLTGGVSRGLERAVGGVVQDIVEAFLAGN
jgi:threonine/homoserine/homoserine lactone efflux protein